MDTIFDTTRYLWPLLTLFQTVITIIGVVKVKGTGPILMLVGTIMTVLRSIVNYLPIDISYSSGELGGIMALTAFSFVGRLLFLVGLLLMVQKVYKPEVPLTGRTEF